MQQKLPVLILFLLIISTNSVLGKNDNKTKNLNASHKKYNHIKEKVDNNRLKRSINDEEVAPFWPNRGKKQIDDENNSQQFGNRLKNSESVLNGDEKSVKELPFWGNRGRRDSSSIESTSDQQYPEYYIKHCKHCSEAETKTNEYRNNKNRREDLSPFWGNRGRRDSDEIYEISQPVWDNRGKKQEKEPFWGNRGRRMENPPFSGNKDRREVEPFWSNRGRREETEPFWGNRGRREDQEPFWGNRGRRQEQEPFWGNRGRRQENEPFWGNRGRRQENEPFWGNRGRREEEPFWGNRGRRIESNWGSSKIKEELKDSILKAIDDIEKDVENLSRLKRSNIDPNSFWANRGRNSRLLCNGPLNVKTLLPKNAKLHESETVLDNKMYVDEPNYILVERSSRSSAEDDPYYISRGKKYYYTENTVRDRRGAIEEIVKSMRNDPYYIARGKKGLITVNKSNATVRKNKYNKAKDLICSTIDLLVIKNEDSKIKREINDNDRDRRTILKKLAAQLQMDPYFVNRGKKNEVILDKDSVQDFINNIAEKCNNSI